METGKLVEKNKIALSPQEDLFLDFLIDFAIESVQKDILQDNNKSSNLGVSNG